MGDTDAQVEAAIFIPSHSPAKIPVPPDISHWYIIRLAEFVDQLHQLFVLFLCNVLLIEVTNKADAYSAVIKPLLLDMAAGELPFPSVRDLHMSVSTPRGAVVYNEVIREAVLHMPLISMVTVHDTGVSGPRSAVVNNDVFPVPLFNRAGGFNTNRLYKKTEGEDYKECELKGI